MQLPIEIISSPLNYTGGKRKLLPQIIPLFPQKISTFVDIFCGGCNVAVNVKADKTICNDINSELIGLFSLMKRVPVEEFKETILSIIKEFNFSESSNYSYSFYDCDSAKGLGKYNKSPFLLLRDSFNKTEKNTDSFYYKLFVLIIFSFNNQIRFNSEGKFNLPVGKRDFNFKMQEKLSKFLEELHRKDYEFINQTFIDFDISKLPIDSFIYADPPYLITTASYNEKGGWTEEDEINLLSFLDRLSDKKIKFALSNVLEIDGKKNDILKKWVDNNPSYYCYHLNFSYKNSNYHKKSSSSKTDEVLITNYEV